MYKLWGFCLYILLSSCVFCEHNWIFKNLFLSSFFRIGSFVGPVNPKNPAKSFFLQLWLLKRLGLWAPETENKLIQTLYTLWSYFYRGFFLWIYTVTQIMFFKDVEDMTVSNLCGINYLIVVIDFKGWVLKIKSRRIKIINYISHKNDLQFTSNNS